MKIVPAFATAVVLAFAGVATADAQDASTLDATIEEATSAAPDDLAADATVMDWEGNTLREGSNGYTCFPTPPTLPGNAPMCLDEAWMAWAEAWQSKSEPVIERAGIAYMLQGDAGASNTDPYAMNEEQVDDWVVTGPHLMIITPDEGALEAMSSDPESGGPWVMWQGTPYAHVMVPVPAP